jgi:hypothetical protein
VDVAAAFKSDRIFGDLRARIAEGMSELHLIHDLTLDLATQLPFAATLTLTYATYYAAYRCQQVQLTCRQWPWPDTALTGANGPTVVPPTLN